MRRGGVSAMTLVMATIGSFGSVVGGIPVAGDASAVRGKENASPLKYGEANGNGHDPSHVVVGPGGLTLHVEFWVPAQASAAPAIPRMLAVGKGLVLVRRGRLSELVSLQRSAELRRSATTTSSAI